MPWLRSGTVACTLNSTTVIGTGTGFVANARVGDAFLGPDGRWYEVSNIASDTALSILPAYIGATVSAGAYALAPMQGYVKDSADQLRTLVNKFGTLAASATITALASLTGAAGKFPYFTAADQMALGTLAEYAKSGQNSDIKALSGLTTALSLAQGGTGVTTIADLLSALVAVGAYGKTNIVGTVSQSNSVPTGAIIETGTNANGRYIKYADGTLICLYRGSFSAVMNSAFGTMYVTPTLSGYTYPQVFTSIPTCAMYTEQAGTIAYLSSGGAGTATSTPGFQMSCPVSTTQNMILNYIAIGRWF